LTIEHEAYERSVLSVSPRTGKAEEFQLTLTARMSLARADGTTLVNNELIAVSRDYLFDEDALLGKASEEDVLKSNLRRQAAASIIRRVYAAAQVP
jgi:LPS-assembly lipoprotein